ncbi:MAG: methyltransferase family protein [Eubacteriales bacterium]
MSKTGAKKRTWWAILVFYFLIAFEIFYMASPFAIYYYSVYAKGLNFLNNKPITQWLSSFFLPHIVIGTKSAWLDIHNIIGGVIAAAGFIVFLTGACQIYYCKFTRRGAVTGGIYNYIRHPQYVSLSVCGFGMLLLWPRYLVLIMYIAMLFAYYFLARTEERECEEKFGQAYTEYKNRTNMFIPFRFTLPGKLPSCPESGFKMYIFALTVFLVVVIASIGTANWLRNFSLENIFTLYTRDSATISVSSIDKNTLERIMSVALSDDEVQERIKKTGSGSKSKFLNYVLPADWYIPEIPMNKLEGINGGHHFPVNYDPNLYKVVFTQAESNTGKDAQGKEIILHTTKRNPLLEATVDLALNKVTSVKNPPDKINYENVPTPLF